jgi:hypothetical protein
MADASILATMMAPELRIPAGWMVGASTRLLDAWSPMIEVIRVPAITYKTSEIVVRLDKNSETFQVTSSPIGRRLKKLKAHAKPPVSQNGLILDLRFDSCKNIAHACIYTGPIALTARAVVEKALGREDIVLIVREDTPEYYTGVLDLLGFHFIRSSDRFIGDILRVEANGVGVWERIAKQWLPGKVAESLSTEYPGLGPKIFISRRGSRFIENEGEIKLILEPSGFRTIYLEDYPPMQQLAAVYQAEQIVAIHGAALGPLLLRGAAGTPRPLKLVEIFGPGYVAQMGRFMASIVGFDWIGIRGKIKPEVVRDLDVNSKPRSHQSSSFYLDPKSLQLALDAIENGHGEPKYQVLM